ncbi:MAG: hypothetical protein HFJ28_06415 [Clostridia bacterium]|jgi:hypothetical protein|nr:hypothetical protein [Clostridia bacterium]
MEKVISKIGETAVRTYRCAAKEASKIAREIKLKSQMAEDKEQIQSLYETIGKNVYEKYLLKETLDIQTDYVEDCAMIDVLANEIEEIRMELLNLKNLKQCPNCHYEIELDFIYCPNCGKEQEEKEQIQQNKQKATIETTDSEDSILKKEYNNNFKEEQEEMIAEDFEELEEDE